MLLFCGLAASAGYTVLGSLVTLAIFILVGLVLRPKMITSFDHDPEG